MTELILNDQQAKLLAASRGPVRVCDSVGNVLGFVSPEDFAADRQYVESVKNSDAGRTDRVSRLILDGMESGESFPVDADWWEAKRAALAKHIGKEDAT